VCVTVCMVVEVKCLYMYYMCGVYVNVCMCVWHVCVCGVYVNVCVYVKCVYVYVCVYACTCVSTGMCVGGGSVCA